MLCLVDEKMEKVLTIKRSAMRRGWVSGEGVLSFNPMSFLSFLTSLGEPDIQFIERDRAEVDDSIKQIIPFFLVKKGSHVLVNVRSDSSGDVRLRGASSCIFGGHINEVDCPDLDTGGATGLGVISTIINCARRELGEELAVFGSPNPLLGVISGVAEDESTDIGRHHVGIFIRLELPDISQVNVIKKDPGLASIRFVDRSRLADTPLRDVELVSNLEGWSRAIADSLFESAVWGCESKHKKQSILQFNL